ncbi:MAG: hypothetical protein AB1521_09910 [Bacteroidota bacterium]
MPIKKIIKSSLKLVVTVYLFNVIGYLIIAVGYTNNYSLSNVFSPLRIINGIISGNAGTILITLLGVIFFSLFKYWRKTKVDYWRGGRGSRIPY